MYWVVVRLGGLRSWFKGKRFFWEVWRRGEVEVMVYSWELELVKVRVRLR